IATTVRSSLAPLWDSFVASDPDGGAERYLLGADTEVVTGPEGPPGPRRLAAVGGLTERLRTASDTVVAEEVEGVGLAAMARVGETPLLVAAIQQDWTGRLSFW